MPTILHLASAQLGPVRWQRSCHTEGQGGGDTPPELCSRALQRTDGRGQILPPRAPYVGHVVECAQHRERTQATERPASSRGSMPVRRRDPARQAQRSANPEAHRIYDELTSSGQGTVSQVQRDARGMLETPRWPAPALLGHTRARSGTISPRPVSSHPPRSPRPAEGGQRAEGRVLRRTSGRRGRRCRERAARSNSRIQRSVSRRPHRTDPPRRSGPSGQSGRARLLSFQERLGESTEAAGARQRRACAHKRALGRCKQGRRPHSQVSIQACSQTDEGDGLISNKLLRTSTSARGSENGHQPGYDPRGRSPAGLEPRIRRKNAAQPGRRKESVL